MDVIARDGQTIVFVEVKTRASRRFGEAAEAVTPLKQLRDDASRGGGPWRAIIFQSVPCRFDVVSIVLRSERPAIEVIQNAFDAR